jgi:hypothetical protein
MPEEYRRLAAECLRIAEGVPDPQQKISLIDMAQWWLQLARQAETRVPAILEPETASGEPPY